MFNNVMPYGPYDVSECKRCGYVHKSEIFFLDRLKTCPRCKGSEFKYYTSYEQPTNKFLHVSKNLGIGDMLAKIQRLLCQARQWQVWVRYSQKLQMK